MTFSRIKALFLAIIVALTCASLGYLISTTISEGRTTTIHLTPHHSDTGTYWTAENSNKKIEIRSITSVIDTPAITITQKIHWPWLAASITTGILAGWITYRIKHKPTPLTTPLTSEPTPLPPSP